MYYRHRHRHRRRCRRPHRRRCHRRHRHCCRRRRCHLHRCRNNSDCLKFLQLTKYKKIPDFSFFFFPYSAIYWMMSLNAATGLEEL